MERCSCPVLLLAILFSLSMVEHAWCQGDARFLECSESDLEALVDFKTSLENPGKRLSSWKGKNCCEWYGVRCNNRTGAVTTINLRNPFPVSPESSIKIGLSGEISPSLLKLESLEYLDLSLNTFKAIPIPEFFGSLKNLRYLNLSKAGFNGLIPPSLGNLSSLQFLDVSSDFSSLLSSDSFEWVSGLVSLEYLAMNQVDISSVEPDWIQFLNKLPMLKELHLSSCGLSGSISAVNPKNLVSLSVIDLSFNSLSSEFPNWLVNINTLTYVDLSNNDLYRRIPLGLGDLPNLRFLNLASNYNLSASCFQLFKRSWQKIERLNLAFNKIHGKLPASIGNMKSLRELHLSVNSIKGGIPSTIGKLCNLEAFDLSGNNLTGRLPEFLEGSDECAPEAPLSGLIQLRLSNNRLTGNLPDWLGQLGDLVELSLNYNLLTGPIPDSLGKLLNLTNLALAGNGLNGSLPSSLGQLSELSLLDVSSNQLSGFVSESHFSKLKKLKILGLSSNSFVFNVTLNWIPPFQVRNLELGSCHLGPSFPKWLRSQNEVRYLDLSNASISDSIPNWFWDTISSNLSLLNVSINQLQGPLPNPLNVAAFADVDLSSNIFEGMIPLPVGDIELLDLSNNRFSGQIPENMSLIMPDVIFLSLSYNQLTGPIPESIGTLLSLQVLDLSNNKLSGNIPSSIGNCSFLKALDLGNNILAGSIPDSLGQLLQLQSLHLNNNNFSGSLPLSFKNLSSLQMLDLAYNSLSGNLPFWIGEGFYELRTLSLRSNSFSGEIPSGISNLTSVQVLDLARNNLTGKIPGSLSELKAMATEQKIVEYLLYGKYQGQYYEESLIINSKGQSQKYTKTLSLVTSIDLSENNLSGDFPAGLTELTGLVILNLSRNKISGSIPENISRLHELSSLDLSNNNLSGSIPRSLSSLSFLGYLNLSNNDLSGQIPFTGQITTFGSSSFGGNPDLCGPPLAVKCEADVPGEGGSVQDKDGDDAFIDKWFYLSLGLGFAAGILIPVFVLGIRKSWKDAYFRLVDKVVERSRVM